MANKKTDIPAVKVGRLRMPIAREIHKRSADIYITENYIRHVELVHKIELQQFGFAALDYVRLIVSSFNQIRQGTGSSLLLVVYDPKISHAAAIELNFSVSNGFWEVKTAQPRTSKYIRGKRLLWQKK